MSNQNQSGNERGGSGNFANDPKRASEEGKKGGQQSQGGSHQGEKSGGQQSQGGSRQGEKSGGQQGDMDHEKGKSSHGGSSK